MARVPAERQVQGMVALNYGDGALVHAAASRRGGRRGTVDRLALPYAGEALVRCRPRAVRSRSSTLGRRVSGRVLAKVRCPTLVVYGGARPSRRPASQSSCGTSSAARADRHAPDASAMWRRWRIRLWWRGSCDLLLRQCARRSRRVKTRRRRADLVRSLPLGAEAHVVASPGSGCRRVVDRSVLTDRPRGASRIGVEVSGHSGGSRRRGGSGRSGSR